MPRVRTATRAEHHDRVTPLAAGQLITFRRRSPWGGGSLTAWRAEVVETRASRPRGHQMARLRYLDGKRAGDVTSWMRREEIVVVTSSNIGGAT